ncbi:sensor histidine kinase [Allosphingosinicella indica]|uniref:histidine kinase n=1 Tax=Allosphingosinicella indica TaxID=941907 RepID=A0A1X7G188_9SPHN|nr:sensor histidine kinase [Allosphingosinicella indica]SMF61643.1 Two-component sensor histidine kinase, contains HisKA and HATPase domains [Allosphingosinicella indica]
MTASKYRPSLLDWIGARFARLSTGLKMLFILGIGLCPLGLIAVLASIESARANDAKNISEIQTALELKAQRLDAAVSRAVLTMRAAGGALRAAAPDPALCERTVERLARAQGSQWRYALFSDDGAALCSSPGFAAARPMAIGFNSPTSTARIADDGSSLTLLLYDQRGILEGVAEFDRANLERITRFPNTAGGYDLEIGDGARTLTLHDGFRNTALKTTINAATPVIGDRLELRIRAGAVPITAAEILIILLPVLMWMGAAGIGWWIVNRLLLKPLVRMQRAVASYQPGDRHLDLPLLSTPAREIGELGFAFDQVTRTVARHEAELEAALERQTRLVREVHHRVKNNLQVVASLINLHARGATSDEVAAAYAAIQRRVDALAVVHRNHYAEFEDNRGVSLRSLISELAANLRATAPAQASAMQVQVDVDSIYATQDVAVSVAFLLTEVIEFAMLSGARSVVICVDQERADVAKLTIESDSLISGAVKDPALADRFERIVTGLSRQLRSTIDRDPERGRYALQVAILDRAERPGETSERPFRSPPPTS